MYHVHACYPYRAEEGIRSPATGVRDSCEPPCGCWELNPNPLQAQQVLLSKPPTDFSLDLFICMCMHVHRLQHMYRGQRTTY